MWLNPDAKESVFSFAIITTTANPLLQSQGVKRMLVILSRSEEIDWIKASNPLSRVLPILAAYPYDKMNAHPVSDMINITGVNDSALLNPIGEKLLKEIIIAPLEQRRHHKERSFPEIPWYMSRQQSVEQKE